jgi:hypothetical protein
MKTTIIKDPPKMWWSGDKRVEEFMPKVAEALDRHMERGKERTDIYNRAYEAVYTAIKKYADGEEKRTNMDITGHGLKANTEL